MTHRFDFGAKVICDGDKENVLTIIAVTYRPEGATEFECAYWHNGDYKTVCLPFWCLSLKPQQ